MKYKLTGLDQDWNEVKMEVDAPEKPKYEVKPIHDRSKNGEIKSTKYAVVRPDDSIVNEALADTEREATAYLDRLRAMGYCE